MRALTLSSAWFLWFVFAGHADVLGKNFQNTKYGYTFVVPRSWHVDKDPEPAIFNLPPSEYGPFELPKGGAVIRIIAAEEYVGKYVKTIEDWIGRNTEIKQRDIERKDLPCHPLDERRAHICTEVRSIFQLSPQDSALVDVSYYFVLGGKYYRAFLEYRQGDKKAGSYLLVLRSIAESVTSN